MIEPALRTQLIANSTLASSIGSRVYVGDTPYTFQYPFVRLTGSGENPDDYRLSDRLIETVALDIFASHNPNEGIYGFGILNMISDIIRKQFDSFTPARWTDDNYSYDVQNAEYRGYATRKNSDVFDVQKPITITLTYNIIFGGL
jgi:hypothetical protein